MTSEDISISSNDLSISPNGNTVFKGAGESNTSLQVEDRSNSNYKTRIFPQAITIAGKSGATRLLAMGGCRLDMTPTISSSGISATAYNDGDLEETLIHIFNISAETNIRPTGITTPTLTQTSKESVKKNISKYNENALEIVLNSEIYKYNLKSEDNKDKQHIGFVIGDEGGDYKTPNEVISKSGEGIDTYSMTSVLWKAVQEQQEIIENLQKQINEMKGEKINE